VPVEMMIFKFVMWFGK